MDRTRLKSCAHLKCLNRIKANVISAAEVYRIAALEFLFSYVPVIQETLKDCQLLFEVEIIRILLQLRILLITYLQRHVASHRISRASLCLEICRQKT